jgi:glycosyltransferase involved in cell wall biosynthesis
MLKIALVSNELPTYRVPFFQRLSQLPGVDLQVIFCTKREPNRQWTLPPLDFHHVFLDERFITLRGRYIHYNTGVVASLRDFGPDVVVTGGFNPTHLYAFAYAIGRDMPHVTMTDGTLSSERSLSWVHRAVRRFVYARSKAFIAASNGGCQLYSSYGVPAERCFQSCLCVDNNAFKPPQEMVERPFDFLFCGRIEEVKNPMFALDVALATAQRLRRKTRVLFVGAGAQEEALRETAARSPDLVDIAFTGFADHGELPALYHSANIFLFPTRWDPWGVVANEACAAGLPVLVSPNAGVAGELVRDGENGFICTLDAGLWAERAAMLLSDAQMRRRFSERSMLRVRDYTYEKAAVGVLDACRRALSDREGHQGKKPLWRS